MPETEDSEPDDSLDELLEQLEELVDQALDPGLSREQVIEKLKEIKEALESVEVETDEGE
jgi:hypothetical protein